MENEEILTNDKKKEVTFLLGEQLLAKLQRMAKEYNTTLNGYVEEALLDNAYFEPNDETIEAMNSDEWYPLDVDNLQEFVNSLPDNDDETDTTIRAI